MGNLYLTVEDERVAGQLLHDVYDEWDDHRQPTVSWCFSFMMLIMFMMILQSTMTVPGDGSGGPGSSTPSPAPSPAADPSAAAAAAGTAAAGLLAGFSLFVVWLLSKLFLVVLPLLMVMRLAARAQVRLRDTSGGRASLPVFDRAASFLLAPTRWQYAFRPCLLCHWQRSPLPCNMLTSKGGGCFVAPMA